MAKLHIKAGNIAFFSLDTLAKAAYIGFSNDEVKKTVRKNPSLFFDYNKDGKLVGIEIIRLQKANATIKRILKDTENGLPVPAKKIINSLLEPSHA